MERARCAGPLGRDHRPDRLGRVRGGIRLGRDLPRGRRARRAVAAAACRIDLNCASRLYADGAASRASNVRRRNERARNAEEALLACASVCPTVCHSTTDVDWPASYSFGSWFRRLVGQRSDPQLAFALRCLGGLGLSGQHLEVADLACARARGANFAGASVANSELRGSPRSAGATRSRCCYERSTDAEGRPQRRT